LGRVGLDVGSLSAGGAVMLHGVRCGEMPGLVGLTLARDNNRDARRTEASVAGSAAAWSRWAEQVLDGQPNLEIEALLQLHPLLLDHDLPVWRFGSHTVTLDDLIGRIVARDELRIHLGEVSQEYRDDMRGSRFHSGFNLSDDLIIVPRFRPSDREWTEEEHFPWFIDVAPIDYKSRLEAALARHWGGFQKQEDDDAVVGEVDGIEIRRSVTVYQRSPPA
jgi:hypothetical protein